MADAKYIIIVIFMTRLRSYSHCRLLQLLRFTPPESKFQGNNKLAQQPQRVTSGYELDTRSSGERK